MRFVLRIFGSEVIAIEFNTEFNTPQLPYRGDCITYPIGFVRGEHE